MPAWWDRILGRPTTPPQEIDDERGLAFYDAKMSALAQVLGPRHEMVGHAIVPVHAGGTVHMHYFPQSIGTAFATEDFIAPDGRGPKPSRIGTYELVALTRLPYLASKVPNPKGEPFDQIERRMCAIFSVLWHYSKDHALNPRETCEVPFDDEVAAVILDEYKGKEEFWIEGRKYGLLLCIEILPSELAFVRKQGGAALIEKLKTAGVYPNSDLDRAPVV